jgi:hypothetical protein
MVAVGSALALEQEGAMAPAAKFSLAKVMVMAGACWLVACAHPTASPGGGLGTSDGTAGGEGGAWSADQGSAASAAVDASSGTGADGQGAATETDGAGAGGGSDGQETGTGTNGQGADAGADGQTTGAEGDGQAGDTGIDGQGAAPGIDGHPVGVGGSAHPSGSGGAASHPACFEHAEQTTLIEEEPIPPILQFQIDITGSMDDEAYPDDAANNASKWEEMQRVLPQVFASLPDDWAVGVSYFNRPRGCYQGVQAVEIAPMSDAQLGAINDSIDRQDTGGYTPTLAAWRFALEQVASWSAPEPLPDYAESPRYVVLLTDGIPTVLRDGCTIQDPIEQAEYEYLVDAVATEGPAEVKTFVVGVLGSEDPQDAPYDPLYMLSQVAVAGGTPQPEDCVPVSGTVSEPTGAGRRGETNKLTRRGTYCHFDMTTDEDFAAGLLAAMDSIVQQVETIVPISCTYDVPEPPRGVDINLDEVTLNYYPGGGTAVSPIERAPEVPCTSGWFFTNDYQQIELCSETCAAVTSDLDAIVEVYFGCLSIG